MSFFARSPQFHVVPDSKGETLGRIEREPTAGGSHRAGPQGRKEGKVR